MNIIGEQAERIRDIGPIQPRIEPEELAAALGVEPCGERVAGDLDPIALAELGSALIKQLRSTGGRPALAPERGRNSNPTNPQIRRI
ncbi:MAG TPA: hypothetical protein VEL76_00900 [Gemmataceae bacterium]|nr:hypothetical protein [Gemmataceae bacterium]